MTDASEIAHITDLLRLHTAMPGEVIIREGEEALSMYFIVAGEVEVVVGGTARKLRGGDFFGELGILYKMPRTATVTAKTFAELLELDRRDIETIFEMDKDLRERIMREAEQRRND